DPAADRCAPTPSLSRARQPQLPGFCSSGLMASALMLSQSFPPETEREVVTSPSGMDIPARKPVFFSPLTAVNAVAQKDALPTGNDSVMLAISERTLAASRVWVKPALT